MRPLAPVCLLLASLRGLFSYAVVKMNSYVTFIGGLLFHGKCISLQCIEHSRNARLVVVISFH